MQRIYLYTISLLLIWCCSCKKTKIEPYEHTGSVLVGPPSTIRLYNVSNGNLNIAVNNVQLTNFEPVNAPVGNVVLGTELGLKYFPDGVWKARNDGSPFTIPANLLDRNGRARIIIAPGKAKKSNEIPGTISKDTTIQDNPQQPRDYFILSDGTIRSFPRTTSVPVKPDHFKLRIIHIGGDDNQLGLAGPVTLTFADGSPVHPLLTQVVPGNTSDYVEIPYGTYQFKLFAKGDYSKQLSEAPNLPRFDPCSRTPGLQVALEPLIRSFKPGGTYSVLVFKKAFGFACGDLIEPAVDNGYVIITDVSPQNTSYARIQAANAYPGGNINFKINGQKLADALAFGRASGYSVVVTGRQRIEAFDETGKLLAQSDYPFSAADNITVWLFNKNGKAEMLFVQNTMGAYRFRTGNTNDDAVEGASMIEKFDYAWQTRFLNVSSDASNVTFSNDGIPFSIIQAVAGGGRDTINRPIAYENLSIGKAAEHDPYIIIPYNINSMSNIGPSFTSAANIRVHNSSQGQVPGPVIFSIDALNFQSFIANGNMYPTGSLPASETGIYTVALIGKIAEGAPASEKAKLMIVKHNQ